MKVDPYNSIFFKCLWGFVRIKIIVLILVLFILGCNQAYKDTSLTSEFSHMIGEEYQVTGELLLYALSDNKHAEDMELANYAIVSWPGLGNAETVSRKVLPNGTVIFIKKVVQCSNCIFGVPIFILVSIENGDLEPDIPIYIYVKS